jgi:hypothetical protein
MADANPTLVANLEAALKAALTQIASSTPGTNQVTGDYTNHDLGLDGTVTVKG